jgi:hypothetical protein
MFGPTGRSRSALHTVGSEKAGWEATEARLALPATPRPTGIWCCTASTGKLNLTCQQCKDSPTVQMSLGRTGKAPGSRDAGTIFLSI